MTAQSGLGFSGIVAIQIPDDGAPGFVLTKLTAANYDYDWLAGGGGGGTIIVEDEGAPVGVPADTLDFVGAGVTASGAGTTKTITIPGGAGDLQAAYDADTSVPQIEINATPDPLTIDATVAGDIFAVRDVANADLMRIATDGSFIFGGTSAGDLLNLQGAQNAPDVGRVVIASPVTFTYDTVSNTTPAEAYILRWEETFSVGAYVGGFLRFEPNITTTSSTYIPGVFVDFGTTTLGAAPGFWAYTFINCLHRMESGAGFNIGSALVVNIGITHARQTAGTSTTVGSTGMNMAAQTRAEVAGAVMRKTAGDTGLLINPSYSAVLGATADLGTTVAVRAGGNATIALGGSGAGTLTRDGVIGIDFLATTNATTGDKVVVRNAMTAAADRYLLQNNGGAQSEHGSGIFHLNDNTPVQFGGGINTMDASILWSTGSSALQFFMALNADSLFLSNPNNGQILFDTGANEMTFNSTGGMQFGDGVGTIGNQFFNFQAGAQAPSVGGDYSCVLLTQAGSYTNSGFAMGRVSAWVINGLSYAGSTGSVTNSDTLTVGGMVTSSPGVTITERQSIHVIAGRSRFQSAMQYDPINPAVLASGNNNNWAGLLTGTANNGMRHWARITSNADGTSLITGIDATSAQDGDTFKITNVGAFNASFGDQDASSAAANRIITGTGATYIIGPDETCEVTYDLATARWRILYGSGA